MKALRLNIGDTSHKHLLALQGYYQGLDGYRVGLRETLELLLESAHEECVRDGTLLPIKESDDVAESR